MLTAASPAHNWLFGPAWGEFARRTVPPRVLR
jgi:hypothetical protein